MKEKKEKLINKYNLAFGVFIVAIFSILVWNILALDVFHPAPEGPVKVYFADNISSAHIRIIRNFNRLNEGEIEIVPINLPFTKFNTNDRKELISRSLRSENSRIDIFAIDQIWVSRFEKWAEPLDAYYSEKEINNILPEILTTCRVNDKLMGIPIYMDLGVLFYRKDLIGRVSGIEDFEEALKNSYDWYDLIKVMQTYFPENYGYVFQADNFEGLICNYVEILAAMGGEFNPIDPDNLASEKSIAACQFMHDLITKYKVSPPEVTLFTEVSSYKAAQEHDIPFFRAWLSSIKDTTAFANDPQILQNIGVAKLPHFPGNESTTIVGGWNVMIAKNCPHKAAAIRFLKYIMSDEVQKVFMAYGLLPVTENLYGELRQMNTHPDFPYREIIRNNSVLRPKYEQYTKISDIVSYYVNNAIAGEIEPEDALKTAAHTITSNKVFVK